MGTITSRAVIDALIATNGARPDESPDVATVKIVEYENAGQPAWGTVLACEIPLGLANRYDAEGEHVTSPRVIWQRDDYEELLRGAPHRYRQRLRPNDTLLAVLSSGHIVVIRGQGVVGIAEPGQHPKAHAVWRLPS